jgi:DNA mismatch endonuclease, patch repair protein
LVDIFSKKKRSQIMSSISGKNTKPEIVLSSILTKLHYRFRQNIKTLPGTPDIVFSRRKKVIFVHGCFWHGHTCKRATLPQTNKVFWKKKIEGNKARDKRVRRELTKLGWKSLIVWQCQITKTNEERLQKRLQKYLSSVG